MITYSTSLERFLDRLFDWINCSTPTFFFGVLMYALGYAHLYYALKGK